MNETEKTQIKGALLKCAEENENKATPTFNVVVSSVCKSAVERIEELEQDLSNKKLAIQNRKADIERLENENAELKEKCNSLQGLVTYYQTNFCQDKAIKDLQKENEELRYQLNKNPCVCNTEWHCNDCLELLTKAKEIMKDEEMAEEYADNISGLELTCSLLSAKDKNHAYRLGRYEGFLAGLKAGRPQWHKVADGLPISDKDKYYFVVDKMDAYMIARFYEGKWSNYSVIDEVIAWCELTTFDKE